MKKEELFLPYELALLAKEKGFNEPCCAKYFKKKFAFNTLGHWYKHNSGEISKNYIAAPLYQQIIDWIREEHGSDIFPTKVKSSSGNWYYFTISDDYRETRCLGDINYYIALQNAIFSFFKQK